MQTLTLTLPRLHQAQREIRNQARRYNVLACGRRFGKTRLGIDLIIEHALYGLPTGWFAPTYKLLLEPWRELKACLAPIIRRTSETERRIELVTGGSIDCWSLDDPNAGRGYKYRRVVIDEAAMVRYLEEAWTRAIRPTLTDMRGDAYFLSTPKGRDFFWRLWTRGQNDRDNEFRSWRYPTTANPFITIDEVEAARQMLPERAYQQEYLAEFIEESGGVFRGVSASIDRGSVSGRAGTGPFTIGVDLARVEDFTVITVVDAECKQVYYERFNQVSWERQINAIDQAASRYPGATIRVDATGVGDPIYEQLRRRGLRVSPFRFTSQSKEALIENLAILIESGRLRLLDIAEQESELLAYQYDITPGGHVRMNAPQGMHDDTVIALALAVPETRTLPKWDTALSLMD